MNRTGQESKSMYILAAIVSACIFAIMFRICALWKVDIWSAMVTNYAVGAVLFGKGIAMAGTTGVLLGIIAACLFVLGFIVRDGCTASHGIAMTTVASRSSLIVPVILSWIILGQRQPVWIAVILVLCGIVMLSDGKGMTRVGGKIPILFLIYGLCNFALPVASHMTIGSTAATGCIFLAAALISAGLCVRKGFHGGARSLIAGCVMGAANAGSVYFSLEAMGRMDATLFYPIFDAGVIAVCTVTGIMFFGEHLGKIQIAGLVLTVLGMMASYIC